MAEPMCDPNGWRRPPPPPNSAPVSTSRRSRSNSSSSGSPLNSGTADVLQEMIPSVSPRNKYTHIIVLKSLNNTFETKFLVVPFKPDGLKLGRPVVNVGSNTSSVNGGMKQDLQPQVRPDNGNFDSRVLSRSHASLSCDPTTGKIYIRDLKSSNGTFVNGSRISQNDVELKVGDVVDLGTDIDTKFEHRKISALVEDISVIPLINEDEKLIKNTVSLMNGGTSVSENAAAASNAQRAAFEAAMFGDVNNLDLEEAVLGSETEILSGIFINNSIGTSPNLINVIKTLVTELSLEKHELAKLKSIENFLISYTTSLEYVNKLRVEKNDIQLAQLQNNLKQKLSEKHEKLAKEHMEQLNTAIKDNAKLREVIETRANNESEEVKNLKMQVEDLSTRLEVEKYKNAQLIKNSSTEEKESSITVVSEDEPEDSAQINSQQEKKGGKYIYLLGALSIGLFAVAFKYSSKSE